MKKSIVILLVALITFSLAGISNATPLYLDDGAPYTDAGSADGWYNWGTGAGRGILFLASSNFSVHSIGVLADLSAANYDIEIYSSSGPGNVGALLASSSKVFDGTLGRTYHNFNLAYNFLASNHYLINFARVDNASMNEEVFYMADASLPIDYGVLTLLDGTEGNPTVDFIDFTNAAHIAYAFDDATPIPEPTTMLLLGTGLVGVAGAARRKKKNQV